MISVTRPLPLLIFQIVNTLQRHIVAQIEMTHKIKQKSLEVLNKEAIVFLLISTLSPCTKSKQRIQQGHQKMEVNLPVNILHNLRCFNKVM